MDDVSIFYYLISQLMKAKPRTGLLNFTTVSTNFERRCVAVALVYQLKLLLQKIVRKNMSSLTLL